MERTCPSRRRLRPASGPFALIRAALTLRRHRHRLSELSDETLRDIGISRDEALREAARPVWDVPAAWRR